MIENVLICAVAIAAFFLVPQADAWSNAMMVGNYEDLANGHKITVMGMIVAFNFILIQALWKLSTFIWKTLAKRRDNKLT